MNIVDEGHIYELLQLGGGVQTITFVKRSGGAIQYTSEWPGVQTQEVLRALIDRNKYLYRVLPCIETKEALKHLRMALYLYEVRAYRRKLEHVNRTSKAHQHVHTSDTAPFDVEGIELLPVGEDGHIIID